MDRRHVAGDPPCRKTEDPCADGSETGAENKKQAYTMQMNQQQKVGEGVKFERIRRITGYLVGTLNRWNNAKKAEEKDRVKHKTEVKP